MYSECKHAILKVNSSYTCVLEVYCLEIKWLRREAQHFSQPSDKFNNAVHASSIRHHGAVLNSSQGQVNAFSSKYENTS